MTDALRSSLRALAVVLALAATAMGVAAAVVDPVVGRVTKVENAAEVISTAGTVTALVGTAVHMGDELSTSEDARLLVVFNDGTQLTLGENASVTVDRYVYDPDRGTGEALLHTTRGAFRFATGSMRALTTKKIIIRTPVATLGVRGTEFWGGPIDQKYGVLLFEGEIEVTNVSGSVTLGAKGEGTSVLSDAAPPSVPTGWPEEKIARALATVALR